MYEQYKVLVKSVAFLGISGRVQAEQGLVHLVADALWTPRIAQPAIEPSRDYR